MENIIVYDLNMNLIDVFKNIYIKYEKEMLKAIYEKYGKCYVKIY